MNEQTASANAPETAKTSMRDNTSEKAASPVVLSVNHVGKYFKLPTEQATGLKMLFINWAKGIKGYKEQHVLRDINFDVHQGDFFGIVGRNGSGKSTLLKLISGIYVPDAGNIEVKGKLVPFIELGVGFNPELTGRENVYLNGALLGFTHDEIDAMYDDIVAFAELEEFMDQKLKNYSSGMQVRLAFSVAIKAQGDILVLDEVLAVGDEAFQRKCDNYFASIKKDPTKTVILVTHDMNAVKKYCNKAVLIKDGEVIINGDKDDVANRYTLENLAGTGRETQAGEYPDGLNARVPLLRVLPVTDPVCKAHSNFVFDVEYSFNETVPFYLAIAMHDLGRGGVLVDSGTIRFRMRQTGHHKVRFSIPLNMFNNGDFKLVASLRVGTDADDPRKTEMVSFTNNDNSCAFAIRDEENKDYAALSDRAIEIETLSDGDMVEVFDYTAL